MSSIIKFAARVLVVDPSAERRDVLGTLLERQGAVAVTAHSVRDATTMLAAEVLPLQPLDLIVVDDEASSVDDVEALADRTSTPIVVLGKLRGHRWAASAGSTIEKPYHYRELIRRIDEVLATRRAA